MQTAALWNSRYQNRSGDEMLKEQTDEHFSEFERQIEEFDMFSNAETQDFSVLVKCK